MVDPLDLDRWEGEMAAVAPIPDETRRPHATEVGPQPLVTIAEVAGEAVLTVDPQCYVAENWIEIP